MAANLYLNQLTPGSQQNINNEIKNRINTNLFKIVETPRRFSVRNLKYSLTV